MQRILVFVVRAVLATAAPHRRMTGMVEVVVYKEAVAQHALEDACLLRSQRRCITAHILANAAFEIIQHVAIEATDFSLVAAFWRVAKNDDNKKMILERINLAYNFFKHADRDKDKELYFDEMLTDHIIYLTILDLERTAHIRPTKDGYTILIATEIREFHKNYIASYGGDPISLVGLEEIAAHANDAREDLCMAHIRNWLWNRTDIFRDNR